jgi:hypothetical protein
MHTVIDPVPLEDREYGNLLHLVSVDVSLGIVLQGCLYQAHMISGECDSNEQTSTRGITVYLENVIVEMGTSDATIDGRVFLDEGLQQANIDPILHFLPVCCELGRITVRRPHTRITTDCTLTALLLKSEGTDGRAFLRVGLARFYHTRVRIEDGRISLLG